MTTSPPSTRSTAAARREHLLEVAMHEFAARGYEGGSTERIARAAGISQPYVFRLFGSKLQLFLAVIERCMEDTLAAFEGAAAGLEGEGALEAIGSAYTGLIRSHPARLQCQLVGYAACEHDDVRAAMRSGFGTLMCFVEGASGLPHERIAQFFANGMLLNAVTAMRLQEEREPWGDRLIEGCTGAAGDEPG